MPCTDDTRCPDQAGVNATESYRLETQGAGRPEQGRRLETQAARRPAGYSESFEDCACLPPFEMEVREEATLTLLRCVEWQLCRNARCSRCPQDHYTASRPLSGFERRFYCVPCPENTEYSGELAIYKASDCTCVKGMIEYSSEKRKYIRNQTTQACRAPRPCNVSRAFREYTDEYSDERLKLGTCRDSLPQGSMLGHQERCHLECGVGREPESLSHQLGWGAKVDLDLGCRDGVVQRLQYDDIRCSVEAYVLPPTMFLVVVTVMSLCAGLNVYRNQKSKRVLIAEYREQLRRRD